MDSITVKKYFPDAKVETERSFIGDDWWASKTLFEASKELRVVDIDIASLDLDVTPWEGNNILEFVKHCVRIDKCRFEYPVIQAPSGWVMNGWHRIVKAIMEGRKTIPAVRFKELPKPDGTEKKA